MPNEPDLIREIDLAIAIAQRHIDEGVEPAEIELGDVTYFYDTLQRAREALRWIPVTERLPEKRAYYWCTCRRPYKVKHYPEIFTSLVFFDTEKGSFKDGEDKVLAWSERPTAPYTPAKEGGEGE